MQAPGLIDHSDSRGKFGLVHNLGLGGAAVVSLMRRPDFWDNSGRPDGRDRYVARCINLDKFAYSMCVSALGITMPTNVDLSPGKMWKKSELSNSPKRSWSKPACDRSISHSLLTVTYPPAHICCACTCTAIVYYRLFFWHVGLDSSQIARVFL